MIEPAAARPPGAARWAPPDASPDDPHPPWGSGLAWLSRPAPGAEPARLPPPPLWSAAGAVARPGADAGGGIADGWIGVGARTGAGRSPGEPDAVAAGPARPPERRRVAYADPGPGQEPDTVAVRPGLGWGKYAEPGRGREADAVGGGPVRLPGRGGVATWLPEGRWAADEVAAPDPGGQVTRSADPAEAARRRGQRRIRLARLAARLSGWPRRALAAMLLLAAVAVALRPAPPDAALAPSVPATEVAVAARDLPAGTVLTAADLRTVSVPVPVVPGGAVARPGTVVGRIAAGPIRRGEVLTDARVVGPGLTAGLGPGGSAAVPVRLAEPEAAGLVRAGDRVDVLGSAVGADGMVLAGDAADIATGLRVLAVLGERASADGVVLVVAATPPVARRLAGAAARQRLTITVRPP